MTDAVTDKTTTEPGSRPAGGGAAVIAIFLIAAWIAITALFIVPSVWLAEQFALAGGREFGRDRWVIATAGFAVAALLPALLGLGATRGPRYRPVFRSWVLAALFALLVLPVQLVSASEAQTAAVVQCAAALVYVALSRFANRRTGSSPPAVMRAALWPALLSGALVAWPWVLWGALGSWVDTALNALACLLFGLAAAVSLSDILLRRTDEPGELLPYPLAGLATSITLLIMGIAFGHNGQQLILLFLLPTLGWLAVAVARWGRVEREGEGRSRAALFIALAIAAPLLFVDPEELALILNLGTRDVAYYAIYATLLSAGIALTLGLLAWPLSRRNGGRALPIALTTAAWAVLIALYVFLGQPGWHGEQLYVILAHQADLTAASGIPASAARRDYVYDVLVRHADATQADLRRALDTGRIEYTPYYLTNALEVNGGPLIRHWLENRPEVDRVLDSPILRPLPEPPPTARGQAQPPEIPPWNLDAIHVPAVWEGFGVRGAGIVIGQSDSGVDGNHPALNEQYRGNQPGGPAGDNYNWLDPWYGTPSPTDWGGHGTHTLGTVLGQRVGVAPEATWIGCVNLARNLGNAPRYLDCLQFLFAPFPQRGDPLHDGRPDLGANVLNNSWGCPEIEGCDPAALLPAVRALRAAGVFVVASAGNDGSDCATIDAPISLYDEVFTVGAIDETEDVAPFSSRGPVTVDGSGRIKPDVMAPGVGVLSTMPGGTYGYNDGTSMAGPHVAGVVALIWSATPSLIGDIDRTEGIIAETARPIPIPPSGCGDPSEWPNNTAGFGLVDAYAAVARAFGREGE